MRCTRTRLSPVVWSLTLACGHMCAQTTAALTPGDYAGTLGPLHLLLHLQGDADGKLSCTLDSLDQGAVGIPCTNFTASGKEVSFTLPSIGGSYRGSVGADASTMTGTWTQGSSASLSWTKQATFVAAEKPSRVDGDWHGAITTPSGPLPAVVHVKSDVAGKEYVTFDSPTQNANGLVGDNASLQGDAFAFDLPAVHGHYSGTLSANGKTITGTWNQGTPLPLVLTR